MSESGEFEVSSDTGLEVEVTGLDAATLAAVLPAVLRVADA